MSDLIKVYTSSGTLDFVDLAVDNGIFSAVCVMLFTNKELEGASRDYAGSRTGLDIGSHLWSILNQPLTQQIAAQAVSYIEQALEPLQQRGLLGDVEVSYIRRNQDGYRFRVDFYKPNNNKFKEIWDNTENKELQINKFSAYSDFVLNIV